MEQQGSAPLPSERRRLVFITEAEPFFLAESFRHLFCQPLPGWQVVGVVLLPFAMTQMRGHGWQRFRQFVQTYRVSTACRFALRYLAQRWRKSSHVVQVFADHDVPIIRNVVDINAPSSIERIQALQPDLIVSLALHQIIHQPLLELPPLGCINVHLGIIPDHRGPAPVFWALHDGDREAGVTVHQMTSRIDAGQIWAQRSQPIQTRCFLTLMAQQRLLGMDALCEALQQLAEGREAQVPVRQSEARYQRWPKSQDVRAFLKNGNSLI
ncbi:MAG: methionyl-tRNA formyltransferase [Hyphomicrobiales bacterium]